MTALATPPPVAADVPAPLPRRAVPVPLSSVHADLMPDEVRTRRRLRYLKRRLVFALVAIVLLIGLGDALVRQQTSSAQDDLDSANARIAVLNQQVAGFGAVTGVQSDTAQINSQLTQVMAQDLPWSTLLTSLQQLAPAGLRVTAVNGSVGDASSADAAATPTGAAAPVGSLTVSGTTRDYRSVADYVVALARIKGLTAVTPSTTGDGSTAGALAFTVDISLTTDALGGRYAAPPTTTPATPAAASAASTPASSTPSSSVPSSSVPATSTRAAAPNPGTSHSAALPEGN